ncbi:YcbK family protein [Thauera aromatica]|uniref:Murein endopeptidase K n=1 Tax=Thauera aromatica K172 TaxID=44139 RepID=A0A2R4BMZ8_THAAR|nr:DUF882 domain-containing protein [Thauera aromatica]AVR88584.1 putative peptidase [Thauera aromatica K172]
MSRTPHDHSGARRRLFLKGLSTLPLGLSLGSARAHPAAFAHDHRLAFRHTHTDERLQLAYRDRRGYIEPALQRMNWLLRDFRTGDAVAMDPRLYDVLHALSLRCGGDTFEIISGYRSPATNQALRKTGSGVARRSLHMDGRAIDIRLAGVATARLRDAALALRAGGVGYYPESDFVHIDTGPVRSWGPRPA